MDSAWTDDCNFDTFGDDSYLPEDRGVVVTASIAANEDTSWFTTLRERSGRGSKPIKYRHVRELFAAGAGELQRLLVQTVKGSLVVIEDIRDEPPPRRALPLRTLARFVRRRRHDESFAKVLEELDDLESRVALIRSPLVATAETLSEGMLDELVPSFYERPEDLDVFTPRCTSTAIDLLDQGELAKELERRVVGRYCDPHEEYRGIVADALRSSLRIRPAFDKGAPAASAALNVLRSSVASAIAPSANQPELVGEIDDRREIRIQVADIAAGRCRDLYRQYGLSVVRDHFASVILNGELVQRS